MAMISWPFDSTVSDDGYGNPVYSRTYSSDVLARILRKYFRDGVFNTTVDSLRVLASTGMQVAINPGDGLIKGRHCYLEAAQTLAVATAHATLERIDLVVLRLDLGVTALSITPAIVTGTPAASPSAPSLTRNSTIWELALAELRIHAASASIPQSVITDTRLDSTRCGVVATIIGDTDTSTYYAQIAADLAAFKADREADFDAWFADLQAALDENVVTNLYAAINKYKAKKAQAVLAIAGWTGSAAPYEQVESVAIVPASCVLFAGPVAASRAAYMAAEVYVYSASAGSVTFRAKKIPTAELTVDIAISEVDA
jgi:hypothetical protein